MVPSTTPYSLIFPKIGGSQPQPKTAITIISGVGKAMDVKFGMHILSIDRNKSPLKIFGKVAKGILRDSENISEHPCIGCITRSSLW